LHVQIIQAILSFMRLPPPEINMVFPEFPRGGNFAAFLGGDFDEALTYAALRKAESVGRPIGSKDWLADMEAHTGMTLAPQRRGPLPKNGG
jgi:putative transposase